MDAHQEIEVDHRMFQGLLSLPSCPLDASRASQDSFIFNAARECVLACECVFGRTNLGQPLLTVIYEGTLAVDHSLRTRSQRSESTCPG